MRTVTRRQSARTGDAIWMKFECGAGSRWVSTTEDSRGDICNFSGCNCGTRVKYMGETDNRNEEWFGENRAASLVNGLRAAIKAAEGGGE